MGEAGSGRRNRRRGVGVNASLVAQGVWRRVMPGEGGGSHQSDLLSA